MNEIKLTIDNKSVSVAERTTIVDAAKQIGVNIPTLCHMKLEHTGYENNPGSCRICVVEVEGRRNLAPSCKTVCTEGMNIHTHPPRVINARRTVMELLLSDHPTDCLICVKSGECELQSLAQKLGIRDIPYQGQQSTYRMDRSPAITRDMNKCIMCRRCETVCNEIQTVGCLSAINRGFESVIAPAFEMDLEKSNCTYCGQCIAVCPTGALSEVDNTRKVLNAIVNPKKTVIVQTAPAVRAALGEEFGLEPGTLVTGKMVSALRKLGFDKIFDTVFAADLTIIEEATKLLGRLHNHLNGDKNVKLPILTSCCPSWVNFFEYNYPDLLNVPSTAKSPQQMFGAIAKTYFAEQLNLRREDLVVVSVMPCVAKKYEAGRDEFKVNNNPDVDISITTRELAQMIKTAGFNFTELGDSDFDNPMGESTGAGVIFANTGGVIEAAVRTAYELHTKKKLEKVEFNNLRGFDGIRSAKVDFDGLELNIGIAHGLGNARKLLDAVRACKSKFHAIEIMACPGGCIGGAGQPYHHGNSEILEKRAEAIYREDAGKEIRKSHENPFILKLYDEFLGEPCMKLSHRLLHTHYFNKNIK